MTTVAHTPLPYLPALVEALSSTPELGIIKAAVGRFVAQRHAWYSSTIIRLKNDSGISPISFAVVTLLQALAWERLNQIDTRDFTSEDFRGLLGELLDSPAAKAFARELHEALGWDDEIDAQQADPQLLRQLVWCALILEIEPPDRRKPCHIAGFDLTAEKNRGLPYERLRADVVTHLKERNRGVDGYSSREMASLALCVLEPLVPALGRRDVPSNLMYGTLRWAVFAHGVALAEVLQPGSSLQLTFQQLIELALEQSHGASQDVLLIIAATRMLPALEWAIAHDVVARRPNADYGGDDVQKAVRALDEYAARLSRSTLAVLRDPPDRLEMARDTFDEATQGRRDLHQLIMRPSTFLGRLEYSFKNPSPKIEPGTFYLMDVFAAGYMKNGTDQFEPDLQNHQQALLETILPALERLRGIDIPARFEAAFQRWFEEAKAGYECLVEHLLEQIPAADKARFEEGAVTVYALQAETGKHMQSETAQDRQDHQGRFGFLIRCEHPLGNFYYEVFPFRALLKRRQNLAEVPRVFSGNRDHVRRAPTLKRVDWAAYSRNQSPADDVLSAVTAAEIGYMAAPDPAVPGSRRSMTPQRLKRIAQAVVQWNMFVDRDRVYVARRGLAGVELVSGNYPPVLRLAEVLIPGLGCLNAVRTGNSPLLTCALDVGAIMATPAFGLVKGVLQISIRSGRLGLLKTLPAFADAASGFIRGTGMAYRSALNPVGLALTMSSAIHQAGRFSRATLTRMSSRMHGWGKLNGSTTFFQMPQRVNGRIGYPLSGRGAAKAGSLGVRIRNVRDYDKFLEVHNIFKGKPQLRADMLKEIEAGAEIRVHVRKDGSRTLIRKDTSEQIFIDLADNTTARLEACYDYRVLKSWLVENEAARSGLIRLAVNRVTPGRAVLDPHRLSRVREAIESGIYLPPLDVRRVGGGYQVVNGNHRLQAAIELRLEHVPVIIGNQAMPISASGAAPVRRNTL
jgi:hypothetical protein